MQFQSWEPLKSQKDSVPRNCKAQIKSQRDSVLFFGFFFQNCKAQIHKKWRCCLMSQSLSWYFQIYFFFLTWQRNIRAGGGMVGGKKAELREKIPVHPIPLIAPGNGHNHSPDIIFFNHFWYFWQKISVFPNNSSIVPTWGLQRRII